VEDVDRQTRLDAWFRLYGARVLAYLLHRTDPETAHDVLQEVFVTAFRKAGVVPEPPIGWLLGTARRLLANNARSRRRHDNLVVRAGEHLPRTSADEDAGPEAVTVALAKLSAADREVLTLSAWYQLTADEAAEALGCSPSTYAVRLHRARRRLAEQLRAIGYRPRLLPEAARD
jgi:RNA polymerase sigma-70 factor, ECF subfamily